jgi:hypothetical protein
VVPCWEWGLIQVAHSLIWLIGAYAVAFGVQLLIAAFRLGERYN